jgi:hypothetical protein
MDPGRPRVFLPRTAPAARAVPSTRPAPAVLKTGNFDGNRAGEAMSKRITTRWYVAAWVVYLIALVTVLIMGRGVGSAQSPHPALILFLSVMAATALIMLVMLVGALINLARQQAWSWFVVVLVLHLLTLGIIGMVAYALAGPEDPAEVVIRPGPRSVA